jgi:hypothetical protein
VPIVLLDLPRPSPIVLRALVLIPPPHQRLSIVIALLGTPPHQRLSLTVALTLLAALVLIPPPRRRLSLVGAPSVTLPRQRLSPAVAFLLLEARISTGCGSIGRRSDRGKGTGNLLRRQDRSTIEYQKLHSLKSARILATIGTGEKRWHSTEFLEYTGAMDSLLEFGLWCRRWGMGRVG